MLAAEMASTTAKPSMILPRNRNVGSLTDIDCGQTRFDSPTRTPIVLPIPSRNRKRELPDSMLKTRAEWIRGRKLAPSPCRGAGPVQGPWPVRLEESAIVSGAVIRADPLPQAAGIDQPRQAVIAIAGVVGDDGQLPGALFVKGIEQIVGDPNGAKSGHQYRRSVANPGHGLGRGLCTLVDHVKKPLRAALLFDVR